MPFTCTKKNKNHTLHCLFSRCTPVSEVRRAASRAPKRADNVEEKREAKKKARRAVKRKAKRNRKRAVGRW